MGYQNGKITAPVSIEDVRNAINSTSTDLGTLCQSRTINIYAKKKPVRYNTPGMITDTQRKMLNYGIYANPQLSFSAGIQSPYWTYRRPRGLAYGTKEWFRLLDFNGYNKAAKSPMLKTDMSISASGSVLLDLNTIVNTSSDVEIRLTDLSYFSGESAVSGVFWDATKKFGYIVVTEVLLRELYDGIPSTKASSFYVNVTKLPFSNKDNVEFFWALYSRGPLQPNQDGSPQTLEITGAMTADIALMACDAQSGHKLFKISKLDVYEHLGFVNRNTQIGGRWNSSMTTWTLYSFSTDMQCTYTWSNPESYSLQWGLRANGGQAMSKTATMSSTNATQWYTVALTGNGRTYTADLLRENDYIISLQLSGGIASGGSTRTFATIFYNVNSGAVTYTT